VRFGRWKFEDQVSIVRLAGQWYQVCEFFDHGNLVWKGDLKGSFYIHAMSYMFAPISKGRLVFFNSDCLTDWMSCVNDRENFRRENEHICTRSNQTLKHGEPKKSHWLQKGEYYPEWTYYFTCSDRYKLNEISAWYITSLRDLHTFDCLLWDKVKRVSELGRSAFLDITTTIFLHLKITTRWLYLSSR